MPAVIILAVLGLAAMFVWVNALVTRGGSEDAKKCEPAAAPPPGVTYTSVSNDALDDATPAAPNKVAVTVLNASSLRGQASITSETLRQLGFSQTAQPTNDPAYPNTDANCKGQIRYGVNGASAARALSLAAPCVQLIRDTRQDASVDLAIGNGFGDMRPTAEGQQVLDALNAWSRQQQGGSEQDAGGKQPPIDRQLLESSRPSSC